MGIIENLFVYGSFFEGQVHHALIKPYIRQSQSAYILGAAYRLEVGYPVVVAEGQDRIEGALVTLDGPDVLAHLLDEYHGVSVMKPESSLFNKITRDAYVEGGVASAKVYVLPRERCSTRMTAVAHGDWRRALLEQPPLPARMTERQMTYVKRLGRSTGREIIPIDLDLYRELIKLELIVDKGRRLALTNLGRDVLRYVDR